MAKKNEMAFLTGLKKDFKRHKLYFYKIPDSPTAPRFMIAKPFDCFISVDAGLGGMEAKYMDTAKDKSAKHNDLRENQHAGLQEIIENGGQAWVFYQIKFNKELRLYYWEYRDFVRLCELHGSGKSKNIPLKALEDMKYIIGHKNKAKVLEYDLRPFIASWGIIGDIYGN